MDSHFSMMSNNGGYYMALDEHIGCMPWTYDGILKDDVCMKR